jgi:hypothetical protein
MNKTRTGLAPKPVAPFASEAEEALWWFRNRALHGEQMSAAAREGQVSPLATGKLMARLAQSKKKAAPVPSRATL